MCGGRRRAQAPGAFGCQPHTLAQRHGCHSRRHGRRRGNENDGPVGAAVGAIPNAVNSRDGQIIGVTNNGAANPPQYPNDKKQPVTRNEKELEANLDHIEEPPAYTPRGSPTVTNEHPPAAPPPALTPGSGADFTVLPILQTRTSAIDQDIVNLNAALASYKLGECGAKCKAKRAGKQLIRDLWAAEELKRGGRCQMSCQERKMVKAQIKAVKRAAKAQIKAVRHSW